MKTDVKTFRGKVAFNLNSPIIKDGVLENVTKTHFYLNTKREKSRKREIIVIPISSVVAIVLKDSLKAKNFEDFKYCRVQLILKPKEQEFDFGVGDVTVTSEFTSVTENKRTLVVISEFAETICVGSDADIKTLKRDKSRRDYYIRKKVSAIN